MKIKLLLMATVICCMASCYYDNEDELHPAITITDNSDTATTVTNSCDTSVSISFSGTIQPLMKSSCGATNNNCHKSGNTSSGIALDNYIDIKDLVINGSFLGCIVHDPGYAEMPQGGGKLDDCSINKIKSWINHSYPNN